MSFAARHEPTAPFQEFCGIVRVPGIMKVATRAPRELASSEAFYMKSEGLCATLGRAALISWL